jgi:hypothetical protein
MGDREALSCAFEMVAEILRQPRQRYRRSGRWSVSERDAEAVSLPNRLALGMDDESTNQ